MNKQLVALIGIAIFGFSTAGSAAIYDFTAEGNALERGYASFNTGIDSATAMPGGIVISASSSVDDDPNAFAYMDGTTTGPGGLGVCGDLRANLTCEPNSDDNQMPGETIHMLFTPTQIVESMTFTGDHVPVIAGTTLVLTIDGSTTLHDLGALPNVGNLSTLMLGLAATNLSYFIRGTDSQIYLSAMTTSAVPVPAAFWLFGTALLGFISVSRRIKV